ncbi:peptidoglycan-binding protein [Rhizobium sp. ARZ01]|uniref:peptidoglycan-binding domain-containing protein n=1 Tax=Rhizobium sp. ARZ01 TaxID=2769313 RepID=UPI00177AED4C|nr:peptidoglycan-binding protein [Rhizobium sp. ARZ01]MBD9372649.1 peptidoglycan-binding protein [Rhizobium sp. ARZ01]
MTSARFAKLGLASLLGLALAGGPAVQAAETKPAVSASKRWESEFSLWQKVSSSSDPAGFEDYLKQYPNGTFASIARLRLAELNAAGVAKPATDAKETTQEAGGVAASEKEKAQAEQKAAEAARLKAEEEAKVKAEKAKVEEERLAAEAERKRLEEAERLRKEEQARAEAEAKRVAEEKAAAERKRAEEAAEAARLKAEQQAKAEAERLKAEQEAKAAAEAKAKADAEQAAAQAERKRVEEAAEAARIRAEQDAWVAAEAAAKADAAAAEAKAKAEAAQAAAEAERAKAEEAAEAARLKAEQAAKASSEPTAPVQTPNAADALDAEALPTELDGSTAAGTATKAESDEAERLARREDNSWSRAVLNGRAEAFEKYLSEYPNGRFSKQARRRLADLEKNTNIGTTAQDDGTTVEDNASASGVVTEQPAARQKLQSQTTVYQTPPDVREAYLDAGTRAQSQRWLNALGYSTGGADGVFGPRTRSAIAAWQRSLGYSADGYLTRKQYRQLRESGQFAANRNRERVARQRYQDNRYANDDYRIYEGPVDGYGVYEGPVDGYLEGPVGGYGGYYEGPVERYYDGPVYQGGMRRSGPGY